MANTMKIHVQNPEPLRLCFDDKIVLKYVSLDHADLDNLDYEHSGHTGFMPSRVSILPDVSSDTPNERLVLPIYDQNGTASKITLGDLRDRMIKTINGVSNENMEKGQYLFLEINK